MRISTAGIAAWLERPGKAAELCGRLGGPYRDVEVVLATRRWLDEAGTYLKAIQSCRSAMGPAADSVRGLSRHWRDIQEVRRSGASFATMRQMIAWKSGCDVAAGALRQYLRATDDTAIVAEWEEQRQRFFAPSAYGPLPTAGRLGNADVDPLTRWISLSSWTFCTCGRMRPSADLSDWQAPVLRPGLALCTSKRNHLGKCSRPIADFVYPESSQDFFFTTILVSSFMMLV